MTNSGGDESEHTERQRSPEKHVASETVDKKAISDISRSEREGYIQTANTRKADRLKEKDETGKKNFGEVGIGETKHCGQFKDVEVFLKLKQVEGIKTGGQSWERDQNNSQIWHIQTENGDKFQLKADVRLRGNDITARIKYENGRELTVINGEATHISQPNGEKWTVDRSAPGKWNVEAGSKDGEKASSYSVYDATLNLKDGSLSVKQEGKPSESPQQQSEIQPEQRDFVPTLPVKPLEAHEAQAPQPVQGQERPKYVPRPLPPIPVEALEVRAPQPVPPQERHAIAPTPIAPKLIEAREAQAPQPLSSSEKQRFVPQPTAPKPIEAHTALPPTSQNREAFVPQPHAPERIEIATPKPLPQPREVISSDFQKQNSEVIEQNLKSMQERVDRARAEAANILPQLAVHSVPIPPLEPATMRSQNAYPVMRPALLHAHTENAMPSPTLVRPETLLQQAMPALRPVEFSKEQATPQPIMHRAESSTLPAAPGVVPIESKIVQPPNLVPIEPHCTAGHDAVPVPVRATRLNTPIVDVVPSIPKAEHTEQRPSTSSTAHDQAMNLEHTRLQGQGTFQLNASVKTAREPSVYDQGPQMVTDSTQKIQLQGGAHDQANPRLQSNALAERSEAGALCDGNGLVQLVSVPQKVPISVSGVRANQGQYEANLSAPALGQDGRPVRNQVTWVSGKIQGGSFYIDQARIDNGPAFHTMGVLPLKQRR